MSIEFVHLAGLMLEKQDFFSATSPGIFFGRDFYLPSAQARQTFIRLTSLGVPSTSKDAATPCKFTDRRPSRLAINFIYTFLMYFFSLA